MNNGSRYFFIYSLYLKYKEKFEEKYKFTNKKPLGYIQYFLLFIGKIWLFVILPICLVALIIGAIRGTL